MSARDELYAYGMAGKYHSPHNSERMSARIDAFEAEVFRRAAEKIRAHSWRECCGAGCSDLAADAADLIDPDKGESADGTG